MPSILSEFLATTGLNIQQLLLAALALGVFATVYGLTTAVAGPSARQRRIRAIATPASRRKSRGDVLRLDDNDPKGILRAIVPRTQKERSDIAKRLRRGGLHRKNAVLLFFGARTLFAAALPLLFLALVYLPDQAPLPQAVRLFLGGLTLGQTILTVSGLILVGFFLPSFWLMQRISDRRRAIEHALPNALDLLVVAQEAGLGFDAAMTRVAHEIGPVAPHIAHEFTILQLEIQAGKDRAQAFVDLSDRTGVAEVAAFANVVVQSMQFGTSVSEALTGYAREMRLTRELKAQERANKLPVKMSAVLAGLMMPVLLMICLTPILIRWLNMFAAL